MEVCCTRPRPLKEDPHWNSIADERLVSLGDDSMLLREQQCAICKMPLVLRGRYLPIQELGHGGFGKAFLALDQGFFDQGKPLAVQTKRVLKQFAPRGLLLPGQLETAEQAFHREKSILNRLKHPKIPIVYDYFRLQVKSASTSPDRLQPEPMAELAIKQDLFYLVQEYVKGDNLQDELEQRSQQHYTSTKYFTEVEAIDFLKQLLNILHYIHTRDEPVIHRDIKPSNIIRAIDDNSYHLIDFGAVKQIVTVAEQGLSENETHFVTKGYSPPEQYDGRVNCSSDLYSLAVTCISLLTGCIITPDSTSAQDLRSLGLPHNHDRWREHTHVSDRLADILNRMMQPEQADRYPTAAAVLQALTPPIPDLPPSPSPHHPITSSPPHPPKRLILAASLGAIGILAAVIGFSHWNRSNSSNPLLTTNAPANAPAPNASTLNSTSVTLPSPVARIDDVANVPSSIVRYGGSTSWAALRGKVDPVIRSIQPRFDLSYINPTEVIPSSEAGIRMLIAGELEFSQSSRGIPVAERELAQQQGVTLREIPVALDAIVLVVHPDNPVNSLTVEQFDQIKMGRLTNWSQLGGADRPIRIYQTDKEQLGTSDYIQINDATEAIGKLKTDPDGIFWHSATLLIGPCDVKPLAIGLDASNLVAPYKAPLVPSSECPAKRTQINPEVFQNNTYPLIRQLTVIVKADGQLAQQAGEAYANMLLSNQGQDLIEKAGFLRIRSQP